MAGSEVGMLGKEDASAGDDGANGGSRGACQSLGARRTFWRSASWSSSRTTLPPLNPENCKDIADPNGQGRRLPAPLTPRSQQNFKARLCLPPLQPLAIARRSLDEWPKAGSDDIGEWPLPCTPSGRESNNGGERLKLDLSNIASNPDMNGGGCKREKIAFFDKKCSKVAEHIYLGGDAVARDRDILKQHAITHILNCVGFVCPEYFKAEFVYRTLWLQDSPSEDITSILYDVFDYFEDVREQGGRVFVHCCQGVSRSTSLVIAYRMWREGQSFDDAFQYVKAARGIADPNMGFACQLLQCQKRVHAIPLSPTSLLRMYRLAPHSPYDPLHLVPKMLNQPSPAALDSRGAFIVNIPCSIYVWIGRKCESIMERDARGAVCQIVRYEKVQGPIEMIWEGEEPSYFWAAFANLLPLMDKSSNKSDDVESSIKICPGERKAESYNVDFEIFQKAIVGGIVPPFASSDTEQETRLPARESSWSILRRKFASGIMKEFLSGSKLAPSRVYPDSLLIVGVNNSMTKSLQSSANHLSSSSSSISLLSSSSYSSLSSSPSYLSPDSISSDSSISSKCLSDSPSGSPSTVPYSDPLTSTSVSFSNMSLLSSKMSPQSISKTSKFIDVNFASKSCSQSTLALSIAERRGSLSKCLTLPKKLTDHSWEEDSPSRYFASELDESRNIEVTLGAEGDVFADQERTSSGQAANNDSCHEKPVFDQAPDNPHEDHASISDEACILNKVVDGCSVYRWPSLEKLVAFRAGDLDSKSIFIFMSSVSGEIEKRILYIWVGRSFNHDSLEGIDIDKVGSNILTQIGLPEDTKIQIVNEDEEPAEFVLVLESL